MDIRFKNCVFIFNNTNTLLPYTFRGFLNKSEIVITKLNGDTMFKIPENNCTIDGSPATLSEVFAYIINNI